MYIPLFLDSYSELKSCYKKVDWNSKKRKHVTKKPVYCKHIWKFKKKSLVLVSKMLAWFQKLPYQNRTKLKIDFDFTKDNST